MIDPFVMVLNVIVLLMNTLVANTVHFVVVLLMLMVLTQLIHLTVMMRKSRGKRAQRIKEGTMLLMTMVRMMVSNQVQYELMCFSP
jgi:hypothetical protein